MNPFNGFPSGKARLTPVPAQFFSELLPNIDHLGEMKVILYAFWFLDQLETPVRFLTHADFAADEVLCTALGEGGLDDALERAVKREVLLKVQLGEDAQERVFYFLNSARGRAAVQSIKNGAWRPDLQPNPPHVLEAERPNIFRLYEENIGPLTPMVSDMLREAEQAYRQEWIEEAISIAVKNNVRRWKYVEAILRSWQEEGRDGTNRRDAEKDRRKYIEGEFADFIEH